MKKLDIQKYQEVLEARAAAMQTAFQSSLAANNDGTGNEDDRILSGERSIGLLVMDRDREILEEIHAALARIRDEEYGLCQICEEEINPKRLTAIPWTRRCIECQEAADRGEAGGTVSAPAQRRRKRAA